MQWSPQQQEALDRVRAWIENPDRKQVFRLFGYAGTGKTTIARELAKLVKGGVLFAAFTGKAASVLTRKGAPANTIHQLIYVPSNKSTLTLAQLRLMYKRLLSTKPAPAEAAAHNAKCREISRRITREEKSLRQPFFTKKLDSPVYDAKLVIIDEVSMVGQQVGADLESFDTPLLVLGDPAQLPPVADGGHFTNCEPDMMLTEIHRQAEGSPVIQLATRVREGHGLPGPSGWGESAVVPRKGLSVAEMYRDFDMVLCGRNATRRAFNTRVRTEVLGRSGPFPEPDDRLVCLRNNHEEGLLNGELWHVLSCRQLSDNRLVLDLIGESNQKLTTEAHTGTFLGKDIPFQERRRANEFDYGYALTCHKAQGSQWDAVCVVDESDAFRQNAKRWLYTAITRAAERVSIISGRK